MIAVKENLVLSSIDELEVSDLRVDLIKDIKSVIVRLD